METEGRAAQRSPRTGRRHRSPVRIGIDTHHIGASHGQPDAYPWTRHYLSRYEQGEETGKGGAAVRQDQTAPPTLKAATPPPSLLPATPAGARIPVARSEYAIRPLFATYGVTVMPSNSTPSNGAPVGGTGW